MDYVTAGDKPVKARLQIQFIFVSGNTHINHYVIHGGVVLFLVLQTAFLRKEIKDVPSSCKQK